MTLLSYDDPISRDFHLAGREPHISLEPLTSHCQLITKKAIVVFAVYLASKLAVAGRDPSMLLITKKASTKECVVRYSRRDLSRFPKMDQDRKWRDGSCNI